MEDITTWQSQGGNNHCNQLPLSVTVQLHPLAETGLGKRNKAKKENTIKN